MAKISTPGTASPGRPSICTCINVRRASRAITRIYDNALTPAHLKVTQFSLLVTVLHAGPLNVSKLARRLQLDRTTLVRNLKALEKSAFIEETATSDPRERAITITDSGRKIVEEAMPYWHVAQKQVEAHLGEENVKLLGLLTTALEGFSATLAAADALNE